MANYFGKDILIQAPDAKTAADFYVNHLGFEITDDNPKMIGLHGKDINLFIEPGPSLGPVLEVTVDSVAEAKQRLLRQGCEVVKDEPEFPRCYMKDPFGLIYNLTARTGMRFVSCDGDELSRSGRSGNRSSVSEQSPTHSQSRIRGSGRITSYRQVAN
jgi:Glyoxalase-like domain